MLSGSKVIRSSLSVTFVVFCLIFFVVPSSQAIPELTITVGDTTGDAGEQNSVITVFMDNVFDTVSAFELWLQLNRPDILRFQTDLDTVVDTTYWICEEWLGEVCVDSVACNPESTTCEMEYVDTVEAYVGNFDTVGTLISGWEMVKSRSITGVGTDIKVTAIADRNSVPGVHPGIAPQGGGVLFRLLGDIYPIHDTIEDRTVGIFVPPFLDNFSFSRADGTSIGILTVEVPDSNFYRCNAWVPPDSEVCLDWEKVNGPPWDSVSVEVDTVAVLDTSAVVLLDGSLTVNLYYGACCYEAEACSVTTAGACEVAGGTYKGNGTDCDPNPCHTCCTGASVGNLDCNGSGVPDMGDLTILIDHLFISLDPLCCIDEGDVDLSGQPTPEPNDVDMGDLTVLIDHLFISLDPLPACP